MPGTPIRRLSPQKHPSQTHLVALVVRRASAWPAARTRPARTAGWHRAGKKTNLDWLRLMDSTQRPHSACLRHSSCRLLILARERQTGGGPARCRSQPCTISGPRGQTTLHCLEASKDAVNITPTDTTSGHRHFPRGFFFWYRTQKRPTTKSVVREILV